MDNLNSGIEFEHQQIPSLDTLIEQALSMRGSHYDGGEYRAMHFHMPDGIVVVSETSAVNEDTNRLEAFERLVRVPGAIGFDGKGTPFVDNDDKGFILVKMYDKDIEVSNHASREDQFGTPIEEDQEAAIELVRQKLSEAIAHDTSRRQAADITRNAMPRTAERTPLSSKLKGLLGKTAMRRIKRQ